MNPKQAYTTGALVGSTLGSLIPLLWGDGFLSISSVMLTALGGFAGIYLVYKLIHGM